MSIDPTSEETPAGLEPWCKTLRGEQAWRMEVPGGDTALTTWRTLRDQHETTGLWPVLLGSDASIVDQMTWRVSILAEDAPGIPSVSQVTPAPELFVQWLGDPKHDDYLGDVPRHLAKLEADAASIRQRLEARPDSAAVRSVLEARQDGPFTSLFDFLQRIDIRALNKRACEALIAAGALDAFGPRAPLRAGLDTAYQEVLTRKAEEEAGQATLFGSDAGPGLARQAPPLPQIPDWPEAERLAREKEALGFFISGHPLDRFRDVVQAYGQVNTRNLQEHLGQRIELACVITSVSRQISKRDGSEWGRITIEDFSGTATVLAFGDNWANFKEILQKDAPVLIRGAVSGRERDEEDPPIFLDGVSPLAAVRESGTVALCIDIGHGSDPDAVRRAEVIFIAVGTPPGEDGSADLQHVLAVAETIGRNLDVEGPEKIVITKSTVPVGTANKVRDAIRKHSNRTFHVCSNPEFLKEGAAVQDFMKPDRVVVGVDSDYARERLDELYAPFVRTGNPILFMDIASAEITKYAANAMLATRISFMNTIRRFLV